MALAVLKYLGASGSDEAFEIEIGENRYYRLLVGSADARDDRQDRRRGGADWGVSPDARLDHVSWEGPVEGPVRESRRGRTRVRLPGKLFNRENRFVQLVSAREANGVGQAVSSIIDIRHGVGAGTRSTWAGRDFELSPPVRDISTIRRAAQDAGRPPGPVGIQFPATKSSDLEPSGAQSTPAPFSGAQSHSGGQDMTGYHHGPGMRGHHTGEQHIGKQRASAYALTIAKPGQHRPHLTRQQLSQANGVGAIVGAIASMAPQILGAIKGLAPIVGQIAPAIMPAIGALMGGGNRPAPPPVARPARPPAHRPAQSPTRAPVSAHDAETQRMLMELLRQAIAALPQTAAAANNAGGARASAAPSAPNLQSPAAMSLVSRARSVGAPRMESSAAPVSYAQAAPALLAALPALAPLLQQVLNPQTIQSVINAPNQHLGTVINGIKDFMNLGIKSAEQDLRHLRELTPAHEDPELTAILASMSLGLMEGQRQEPRYKRVSSVTLAIADTPPVDVQGIEAAAYQIGKDWGVELSIETPRTIRDGQVRLFIKDAETLEILVKARTPKADIQSGPLPQPIAIPASATEGLDPGRRYLLCVHVVWKNASGKPRGTSVQQEVVALGAMSFERVELAGDVIALADPVSDREVWHQIWSGDFDTARTGYAFDVTYRLGVLPDGGQSERKPTRLRIDSEDTRQVKGRLKAGMRLPLSTLLDVRDDLMPDAPPLSQDVAAVLRSTAFKKRMTLAARAQLDISGLAGKKGTIWAYLGIRLGKITLNRVDAVDDLGRVTALAEEEVDFPVPVSVNFAGYRTSGRDRAEAPMDEDSAEAPDMLNGMKKLFERQVTLAPEATMALARGAVDAMRHARHARHARPKHARSYGHAPQMRRRAHAAR